MGSEDYYIPNIVLVGYGRTQVYQIKCLKCKKLFFPDVDKDRKLKNIFCEDCFKKHDKRDLIKKLGELNVRRSIDYLGNIVGWEVKTPATPVKRSRYNYMKVYTRDEYTCQYCGYSPTKHLEFRKLHIDHINPWYRGGGNSLENLVVACSVCNLTASYKVFANFGDKREFVRGEIQRKGYQIFL